MLIGACNPMVLPDSRAHTHSGAINALMQLHEIVFEPEFEEVFLTWA